jgi:hypothetical protein
MMSKKDKLIRKNRDALIALAKLNQNANIAAAESKIGLVQQN